MEKQISLFDMELPPQSEIKEISKKELKNNNHKAEKVNFARVPDNEPKIKYEKISTINDIIKLLDTGSYKVGRHELLSDVFQCGAIAIANKFDRRQAKKREETYLSIRKKYDKDTQQLITEIFAEISVLLLSQIDMGFDDYLGELYMLSETSNSKAGQFFTPYSVSKACAEACIDEKTVNEYIEKDKILTINEPACGAGGMIIAAIDILYNRYRLNYSRNVFVECSDVDQRCVHMTYLQLSLIGVPAIVYQRDTLTMKTWQKWETPAYIMQYLRFKNMERGMNKHDFKQLHRQEDAFKINT